MTRVIVLAALACAALTGNGANALTLTQSYNAGFSHQNGPVSASGMLFTSVDRLTGDVIAANGSICTYNGSSSCEFGAFVIDADPIAQTATITGTVGPMTVNLQYVTTHISSLMPYFDAELNPTTATLTAFAGGQRSGRISGTIASTNGTVTLTDAPSFMGWFLSTTTP